VTTDARNLGDVFAGSQIYCITARGSMQLARLVNKANKLTNKVKIILAKKTR
jgi:hypothetical protein